VDMLMKNSRYIEIYNHIRKAIKALGRFDDEKLEGHLRMATDLTNIIIRQKSKEKRKAELERAISSGNELCYKCGSEGWCWGYELINYEYDGNR